MVFYAHKNKDVAEKYSLILYYKNIGVFTDEPGSAFSIQV